MDSRASKTGTTGYEEEEEEEEEERKKSGTN
jgi:hypothetical protein